MTSAVFVIALDERDAAHLVVAVHRHREDLRRHRMVEPVVLAQLEDLADRVRTGALEHADSSTDLAMQDDQPRDYLNRHQAARICGVHVATIDRWIAAGHLKVIRRGRIVRIRRADLDKCLSAAA